MDPEQNPNLPLETETPTVPEVPQPEIEPTDAMIVEPAPEAAPAAPAAEIDYKQKFADSTREAQILAAQLEAERAKNARRDASAPSDTELRTEYPEWEYMSDTEKPPRYRRWV